LNDQRNTAGLGDEMAFAPFFPAIHGVGACVRAPFFPRTLAESTITVSKFTMPARPSWLSSRRCSCGHTPAVVHSLNRLQQVVPLGQSGLLGRNFHWHPVRSTCTMPSRQGRSGLRGAPPRGSGGCWGKRGCTSFQSSSVTKGFAMGKLPCNLLPWKVQESLNVSRVSHRRQRN
jgi:hypothetical protein